MSRMLAADGYWQQDNTNFRTKRGEDMIFIGDLGWNKKSCVPPLSYPADYSHSFLLIKLYLGIKQFSDFSTNGECSYFQAGLSCLIYLFLLLTLFPEHILLPGVLTEWWKKR